MNKVVPTIKIIKNLILVFLILSTSLAVAQFDKKVSFNLGGGYFIPLGTKVDADDVPYVFPNFTNGYQVFGGGQYNLNPNISIGLNFVASLAVNYKNPIKNGSDARLVEESKNYFSYFTNFGLGLDIKYKFLPTRKLNPYLFFEVNGNYYYGEVQPRLAFVDLNKFPPDSDPSRYPDDVIKDKYTILRYNAQTITPTLAFGIRGGIGMDYRLSDSFSVFVQGGYSSVFAQSNPVIRTSLDLIGAQAGIRFSVFKSKSIL